MRDRFSEFIFRHFYIIVLCVLIAGTVVITYGAVRHPVPPTQSPTLQELQAEIDRLKPYEAFMNSQDITVVYNGCEDMRKRLGLTP